MDLHKNRNLVGFLRRVQNQIFPYELDFRHVQLNFTEKSSSLLHLDVDFNYLREFYDKLHFAVNNNEIELIGFPAASNVCHHFHLLLHGLSRLLGPLQTGFLGIL